MSGWKDLSLPFLRFLRNNCFVFTFPNNKTRLDIKVPTYTIDAQTFSALDNTPELVPVVWLLADCSIYVSKLSAGNRVIKLHKRVTAIHVQGEDGLAVVFEDQSSSFYTVGKHELICVPRPPCPSRRHFSDRD